MSPVSPEKKGSTMRVLRWSPLVAIATIALLLIAPKQFSFIYTFLPLIYCSIVLSPSARGFNYMFFLVVLAAAMFLPTGFFTLDLINIVPGDADVIVAPTHDVVINYDVGAVAAPTFNLLLSFPFFANLFFTLFAFVLPVVMLAITVLGVISGLIQGRTPDTTVVMRNITRALVIVGFAIFACVLLDLLGLMPQWFVWTFVRDFFVWIVELIAWLGAGIGNLFGAVTYLPDAPAFPTYPDISTFSLDMFSTFAPLSAGQATTDTGLAFLFFNINMAIPWILALLPTIMYWFQRQPGVDIYVKLNPYLHGIQDDYNVRPLRFNPVAIVFATAILTYMFAVFLNFGEPGLDLGVYSIISIFALVLLAVGAVPIKTGRSEHVVTGTLAGAGAILFTFNLVSSGLSVLPSQSMPALVVVLNQVFFVAPTESLLFHVVMPGLAIAGMHALYQYKTNRARVEQMNERLYRLRLEQGQKRQLLQTANKVGGPVRYGQHSYTQKALQYEIFSIQNQITEIEQRKSERSITTLQTILLYRGYYIVFLVAFAFVLPNFLFATYHTFRSQYNIVEFWVSGLAFVYFGAGGILTGVCIRWGWLACILSHALVNMITLTLMGVFV